MMCKSVDEAIAGAEALVVCKRVMEKAELQRLAAKFTKVFDLEYLL